MCPIIIFFSNRFYYLGTYRLKKNYLANSLHIQIKLGQTSALHISILEIKPPKPHAYWLAVLQFVSCCQSTCTLNHKHKII